MGEKISVINEVKQVIYLASSDFEPVHWGRACVQFATEQFGNHLQTCSFDCRVLMLKSLNSAEDENVTSLSVEASRKALEMANVKPEEVDLLLLCTSTPDDLFGSAPQVGIIDG